MKRKWIPPFLMLFAGAVVSIVMFRAHYGLKSMLLVLFAVLLGFYAAGCVIKWMLDTFERQNEALEAAQKEEAGEDEAMPSEETQEGQVKQE